MKVSVSILKEINDYKNAIKKINKTDADYIHLDIMDNTLTNTSSFKIDDFMDLNEYNNKKLDIHLMTNNLEEQINDFIKLKPEFITFQIESTKNINKYINFIKSNNIKVGLSVDLNTSIDEIIPFIDKIDLVLIMSVPIGRGGQKFNLSVLEKLKKLRTLNKDIFISIDGGINVETAGLVSNYVDMLVAGSYITDSDNYLTTVKVLKKIGKNTIIN